MSDLDEGTVHAYADELRRYATHFVPQDWCYTRQHDIKHIRHPGDWSGYDHPVRRALRLIRSFGPTKGWERAIMGRAFSWRHPIITARSTLSTESHQPDGVLDNGAVITHWEETGEYLQYVQPSVGTLLADLMDAHPDLPEVQAVAAEMQRINDDYSARIERGEV